MKQIKSSFNTVLLVVLLSLSMATRAKSMLPEMDSVRISLLTCGPGNEIWSLYGHTAIRYNDTSTGKDIAINYGMFSFRQSFFVLRFVFGLTDYKMGICSMADFLYEYEHAGRWVVQQDLNLTNEDKIAIANALYENSLPQNVSYRYNYFYDNCTTRARDILADNINGKVVYLDKTETKASYRDMIHQWNGDYPWARFGKDLLLGAKADFDTDTKERQFLPDSLRKDFDNAYIVREDGTKDKLVSKEFVLTEPPKTLEKTQDKTPLTSIFDSPGRVLGAVFFIILLLTGYQYRTKRVLWPVDLMFLSVSGAAGLILLAMVFSQHPTVNLNLQILVLNPLSLFFLYPVIKNQRKGKSHSFWKLLLCCSVLYFLGGFFQDYAEGMDFVALSLLVRSIINIKLLKR